MSGRVGFLLKIIVYEIYYIFSPFFLLFLFLSPMYVHTYSAIAMNIPAKEQALRVKGIFYDASKDYSNRRGSYPITIIASDGVKYQCSCVPIGSGDCLTRHRVDSEEIRGKLDAKFLKNHNFQHAMIKWLDGKSGEVWLYPTGVFGGAANACYQISDDSRMYMSFDQSVEEYSKAKTGLDVFVFWVVLFFVFIAFLILITRRINAYRRGGVNG